MKAREQKDAAIAAETTVSDVEITAVEQTVDTPDTENTVAEQGSNVEMPAVETAAEDQPHGETVQEAAATPDPTDFVEIYRARLIASAIQNAHRMTEYGDYLSQHVPSATEGIGQLVGLYQDAARKCVAEWH